MPDPLPHPLPHGQSPASHFGQPLVRTDLLGRRIECAALDAAVSAMRRGESRSLVLRGEPGVGKTALLDYLAASASDLTVLRSVGVQSDMELGFAGLHQVCAPLLDFLPRIPAPQRRALETAFGLSDGAAPDRFLIALASLSLLAAASEHQAVLCLVDDAQWLDQSSLLTFAFVARRLLAEPVGIVFATRQAREELEHLPELQIDGLDEDAARRVLRAAVRFQLDEGVGERIVAETRGNPLALMELPRGLTATQLAGGFGLLEAQALSGRIEQTFLRRLEPLARDAQQLLLLASAEPLGDPLLLWRAAEILGIGPTAALACETQGLLSIGERVTFRHPLVRSATYGSADPHARRAVHLALAQATHPVTDPDRRAWHLASAASGPDEHVAAELVRSAGRAQARGGLPAAAAFLRRAVALTQNPALRTQRALDAAQTSLRAGAFDAALGLLANAEAGSLDELQTVQVDLLRAHVAFAAGRWTQAPGLLLSAARQLESLDAELARETYLTAWGAAGLGEGATGRDMLLRVSRAARAFPAPDGQSRPLDVLLDGLALLITDGHAAANPLLQQAVRALDDMSVEDVIRWGWMVVGACGAVWDHERWLTIAARQVEVLRQAGALAALPVHLTYLGMATAWAGDLTHVAALVAEIDDVSAATGSHFPPYTLLRLRALESRPDEANPVIASAVSAGTGVTAARAHWADAVLHNGLGDYAGALAAAQRALAHASNHWLFGWVLPELVEAAARTANLDVATAATRELGRATAPAGTDEALGIQARCDALISDAPEALYLEAIERLSRTRLRPEMARAHLLYGEWLRRSGRRVDARRQLRAAYDTFAAVGMQAFADRARRELLATGEKVRRHTAEARDDLTGQERQIAMLAREGLSNSEIGARLFLSPRTVEWHLRNVFSKLDIRSRRQLRLALPTAD